jgi:hypothetical protein
VGLGVARAAWGIVRGAVGDGRMVERGRAGADEVVARGVVPAGARTA